MDIEEAKDLAEAMPERTARMNYRLASVLTEMKASYPYYCPTYPKPLPNKEKACTVLTHARKGQQVEVTYQENGARITRANLIYTLNGKQRYEEWFRSSATVTDTHTVSAELPKGTTHYYINLIDENQFLVSYPEVVERNKSFADSALSTAISKTRISADGKKRTPDWNVAFNRFDTNKDNHLSLQEYKIGQVGGANLERRFNNFDRNKDGKVSLDEFVNRGNKPRR